MLAPIMQRRRLRFHYSVDIATACSYNAAAVISMAEERTIDLRRRYCMAEWLQQVVMRFGNGTSSSDGHTNHLLCL